MLTNTYFWFALIFLYYFLATFLPIDKIIGRFYPVFGICLVLMALGVSGGMLVQGYHIPEITLHNLHPDHLPIWPLMFVTVACGAISGFHATQSPPVRPKGYGWGAIYHWDMTLTTDIWW